MVNIVVCDVIIIYKGVGDLNSNYNLWLIVVNVEVVLIFIFGEVFIVDIYFFYFLEIISVIVFIYFIVWKLNVVCWVCIFWLVDVCVGVVYIVGKIVVCYF